MEVAPSRRRREGFPGQHHVVLPPAVVERARQHRLLGGLFVTDAGSYPHAAGHYVEREHGAPGTVLIVCMAGRGWVRWRGREADVQPGGVVVLPPHEAHAYGADAEDPWTIEWAHFTGSDAGVWRQEVMGVAPEGPVVQLPPALVPELDLARVHERLEAGYSEPLLLAAAAALRWCLAELARVRHLPGNPPTLVEAVEATAVWMREHLAERITLGELAARARLSPSHYSAVFRLRFGFAPIDWLIRQRIQRACRLLDTTKEKIEVIGLAVGFSDPYYFSRTFRRVMGAPPRRFRLTVKG